MLYTTAAMFAFAATVYYILFSHLMQRKVRMDDRLARIGASKEEQEVAFAEQSTFYERITKPFLQGISSQVNRITPSQVKQSIALELKMAGNPFGLQVQEWIAVRLLLVVIGAATGILFGMQMPTPSAKLIYLVVPVAATWLLPQTYLKRKARERQVEISRSLPDNLDLLTVSVEAGLGFDQALNKVVEKSSGPLAEEFSKTIQEMQLGKPRREALKDLGIRTGNDDLITFTNALVQADKLGISLGNVLRIQAVDMRTKRRQLAEERAMKAPIKMLFPLIFFVFPALFIIILGPAAIRIVSSLSGQ